MSGSSGTWKAEISEVDDPLVGYHKKPIISLASSPNAKYLGRVIVELWDNTGARDDADALTISAGAMDGKHGKLLARIAEALLVRVQRSHPFEDS